MNDVRRDVAVWDKRFKWGSLGAVIAIVSVLALAPAASAQNSSVSGYESAGAQTQVQVQPGQAVGAETTDPSGDAGDAGVLPFTGLDLLFLAGGGLILVGAGAGLARVRPNRTS
jgi:hypothetical protein